MARTTSSASNVSGFAELERKLLSLGKQAATKLGATAVRKGAQSVLNAAKSAAPVGPRFTGQRVGKRMHVKIKDGLKVRKGRSRSNESVTFMVVTGGAFQALFQELGTIHQAPEPFLGPAVAASADEAVRTTASELEKAIERHLRRP